MNTHVKIILVASFVLLIFPFIALSEFWATLFVIIPAFLIIHSARWIQKNVVDPESNVDSLDAYIQKLQTRFQQQKSEVKNTKKSETIQP